MKVIPFPQKTAVEHLESFGFGLRLQPDGNVAISCWEDSVSDEILAYIDEHELEIEAELEKRGQIAGGEAGNSVMEAHEAGLLAGFEESKKILKKCIERFVENYNSAVCKFEPLAILKVLEMAEHHPESGLDEKRKRVMSGMTYGKIGEAYPCGFDTGLVTGWDAGKRVIGALAKPCRLNIFLRALDTAWKIGARKFTRRLQVQQKK